MHLDRMFKDLFKDTRLARMSDGHYCLVRDLGLVKGGKGLRYHEVVVDFSFRGAVALTKQVVTIMTKRVAARFAQRGALPKWTSLLRSNLREPQ